MPNTASGPATGRLMDLMTLVLLVVPMYGSFFPLESYLSLGQGEGLDGFVNLPIPVTSISLVAMSGAVAFYFFWLLRRRGRIVHEPLIYAFIALAFVTMIWSPSANITFLRALRLMPILLLAVLLPQVYGTKRLLRLMTIAFLISALLSVFMALAVPALGNARLGGGYESAWRGAMVHKNLTGIVFALGVLICWAAYLVRAAGVPLAATAGVACLVMVGAAQSGTAVAGLLLALPVGLGMILIQRSPAQVRLLMLFFFLLLAVAGAFGGLLVIDALFSYGGRDLTFTGRTPIWAAVWQIIWEHPLRGYGYALWVSGSSVQLRVSQMVGDTIPHSHNSWLDLWLQLGLLGLLAIVAMTLIAFARSLKLIVMTRHRLGPALFAILFLLLFRSMTEVQYSDPFPSMLFFLGLCAAVARLALAEVRDTRNAQSFRSRTLGEPRFA